LWTNDSLFLRDHLLIPVPCDSPQQQCILGPVISDNELPHYNSGFSKVLLPPQRFRENMRRPLMTNDPASAALVAKAEDDLNQVDVCEYFSKYDSLLAKVKNTPQFE